MMPIQSSHISKNILLMFNIFNYIINYDGTMDKYNSIFIVTGSHIFILDKLSRPYIWNIHVDHIYGYPKIDMFRLCNK